MAKSKMTKCKSCGTEISAVGKVTCPKCGRVNKPPFYKSGWFIFLCVVLVIIIIVASSSSDTDKTTKNASVVTSENTEVVETEPEPVIKPMVVTVDEIVEAFEENSLKATKTYENKYVKLTGKLKSIDGDGDSFSLEPMYEDYSIDIVECRYKNEHLDTVMNLTVGQEVTVIGTITSLKEVARMKCKLQVESIK